jgi:hypothetical protein
MTKPTVENYMARDWLTHWMVRRWLMRTVPQFDVDTISRVELHRMDGRPYKAVVHRFRSVHLGWTDEQPPVEVAVQDEPGREDWIDGEIDALERAVW